MSWNPTHAYPIVARTMTEWLARPYEDLLRLCEEPIEEWLDLDGTPYVLFVEARPRDPDYNAVRLYVGVGSGSTQQIQRVEESRVRSRPQ